MSRNIASIREALRATEGLLRLAPCWVPRPLHVPGGRLRLHPSDLYALGAHRGGIDERWFCSTTNARNGPATPPDEGLSYIDISGQRILFKQAIDEIGDEILGSDVMAREGGWRLLCKFFDNLGPIPFHMHPSDAIAALTGQRGKPEAYYYPPQYNTKENNFPYTFMGLEPGTTRDDIRRCLQRWHEGDNGILFHSKAYKLQPGAGWQLHTGILHAPGSLVTYEPQAASDASAMFQSMVEGRPVPRDFLVKDVPPEYHHDLDFILDMLDWDANVDPNFAQNRRFHPLPIHHTDQSEESWIVYSTAFYSAKQLTVFPNQSVTVKDAAAYGIITVQGHGTIGTLDIETPTLIRYGQMTKDELFVTAEAARRGVTITNRGATENLVLLKHFGPNNPEAPRR
ncbi:MAG: hypothetical protein JST93_37265 [Acidobacteria bacterium]|nr:hypothetical protein [Acidobacteriota bacterium]